MSHRDADDEQDSFESDVSRDGKITLMYARPGRTQHSRNHRTSVNPWQRYEPRNGSLFSRKQQKESAYGADARLVHEEKRSRMAQKAPVLHYRAAARPQQPLEQPSTLQREDAIVEFSGTDFRQKTQRKFKLRALRKSGKRRTSVPNVSKEKVISVDGSSQGDSIPSVNNDWANWLVLHGNSKVVSDDVCDIGKMVGLQFKGDKNNRFDALSGAGRKHSESGGRGD